MGWAGGCPTSPEACCISEEMKPFGGISLRARRRLWGQLMLAVLTSEHKLGLQCAAFSTRQTMVGMLFIWHTGTTN